MQIHDIPWLVFLPQIEKLTYALETLLITNPSSTAMKTLIGARTTMGNNILPLRDVTLTCRTFAEHYIDFIDGVSQNKLNLNALMKEGTIFMARRAAKKIEPAQQALSEFREELESVVSRIVSLVGGDDSHLSLFITKSTQVISTMIPAIDECITLLQEYNESFQNIYKQNFDPESFEHNPPSDAEFQLAREKWETLKNFLYTISTDWNLLEARMASPDSNRAAITPDSVRDAPAVVNMIAGDPVNSENPPDFPHCPKKVHIPFWGKFFQYTSTCLSSKLFC